MPTSTTAQLYDWLHRLRAGDDQAREQLLQVACARLRLLARRMLRHYPRLQRWEQTDDVVQNALLRLYRSLQDVRPESVAQFFGLAATQIRRELIDLARHHFGPEGGGAHHASDPPGGKGENKRTPRIEAAADPHSGPPPAIDWQEFHEAVVCLPDEERQLFDLLWYQGLTQAEAADILGTCERTVKRRWRQARLALRALTRDEMPGE